MEQFKSIRCRRLIFFSFRFPNVRQKNVNSGKYFIEACPNSDLFTDWLSIFKYIDGIRNLAGNENHIKNLCDIVVESAKLLKDCVIDGAQRHKLKQLVELLAKYLRHFQANPEIVGKLLYVYDHIDSDMHLEVLVIAVHGNYEGLK